MERPIRAAATVVAAALVLVAAAGTAKASGPDCRAVAGGPFLYHTTVIPESYVDCASPQRRIRVYATLSRDGVDVRSERRDCRNMSRCFLDIDVSAQDVPGDQRWCVRVSESVGNAVVPEASLCEAESF